MPNQHATSTSNFKKINLSIFKIKKKIYKKEKT